MALSYVTYSATGGTNYSVTFPYIEQADVSVYVDGVLQTEGAGNDYTWFSATVIQFTVGSTPAVSQEIIIRRTTEDTARLVDFQDAGNLTEADLDLSANQLFYLVQEGLDNTNDLSMQLDTDNKWDAESHPIKNLTDPTNAQDAVTKNYLDVTWTAYMDAAVAAAQLAQTGAETAETNAEAAQTAAEAAQTLAETAQTNTEAVYDAFDDRYLGSKASDPTLDNDGDALLTGALYYDTTLSVLKIYNGASWDYASNLPSLAGNAGEVLRVNVGETAAEWHDLTTDYYTKTLLDGGQLDTRYYTETELNAGQLDTRYYTETEADANFEPLVSKVTVGSDTVISTSGTSVGFSFTGLAEGVYEFRCMLVGTVSYTTLGVSFSSKIYLQTDTETNISADNAYSRDGTTYVNEDWSVDNNMYISGICGASPTRSADGVVGFFKGTFTVSGGTGAIEFKPYTKHSSGTGPQFPNSCQLYADSWMTIRFLG